MEARQGTALADAEQLPFGTCAIRLGEQQQKQAVPRLERLAVRKIEWRTER